VFDSYIPHSLPVNNYKFIAPYWADADIRHDYQADVNGGQVQYRQSANPNLLVRATNEIKEIFSQPEDFKITNLFIATWNSVAYFSMHDDKVCMQYPCSMIYFIIFLANHYQQLLIIVILLFIFFTD